MSTAKFEKHSYIIKCRQGEKVEVLEEAYSKEEAERLVQQYRARLSTMEVYYTVRIGV